MGPQMHFLPTPPPRGAWVFRWTFSSLPPLLPPLPHLQSFVSLRYRMFLLGTENAVGGGRGSLAVYAILFFFSFTPLTFKATPDSLVTPIRGGEQNLKKKLTG